MIGARKTGGGLRPGRPTVVRTAARTTIGAPAQVGNVTGGTGSTTGAAAMTAATGIMAGLPDTIGVMATSATTTGAGMGTASSGATIMAGADRVISVTMTATGMGQPISAGLATTDGAGLNSTIVGPATTGSVPPGAKPATLVVVRGAIGSIGACGLAIRANDLALATRANDRGLATKANLGPAIRADDLALVTRDDLVLAARDDLVRTNARTPDRNQAAILPRRTSSNGLTGCSKSSRSCAKRSDRILRRDVLDAQG
jgi:hypothetical protein